MRKRMERKKRKEVGNEGYWGGNEAREEATLLAR